MSKLLSKIKELPILGILRGISEEHLEPLTEAIISSGLKSVEITMNTPNATALLKKIIALSSGRLIIGAGTVLNSQELSDALEAGARFIVTPSTVKEVVEYCSANSIPVFPGALTPTEIHKAWQLGASMIKIFPASLVGPAYFREIKAPFNNIELMAVGGVSEKNISEFFRMGASAVAFGASIFKNELIDNKRYGDITIEIKKLIQAYQGSIE